MKIEIIDYFDVWGNEKDGWDINDVIRHKDIKVKNDNDAIFEKLIELNLIPQGKTWEDYYILEWDNGFELYDLTNDKPICAIYFS